MKETMRKRLYATFDGIGTALGATEAGLLAAHRHWLPLDISLAVYGFLSARLHGIARKNVTVPLPDSVDTDNGTD